MREHKKLVVTWYIKALQKDMKIKMSKGRNMFYPPNMLQKGSISWYIIAKSEWIQISVLLHSVWALACCWNSLWLTCEIKW